MDKVISVEERIRRAEERYNKRNPEFNDKENRTIKVGKKKKIKRRLIFQIFTCLLIYIIFYAINNRDYVFSDNFKNDVNTFFTEKTKIYEIYSDIKNYIDSQLVNSKKNSEEVKNKEKQEVKDDNNIPNEEITSEGNVGGADESEPSNTKAESQMEKDVKEIKSKVNFINPIVGKISSTFGWRNPTVSTVPKYHTGLDIAAVTGTVIKSSTDGTIAIASSDGDYGKHYFIEIEGITIIYAHCSKLYLKQGDIVKQGQEIAEVGSTGNSTGPHLHIGIKYEDRWIDPELILDI